MTYITDDQKFGEIWARVSSAVDTSSSFPEPVARSDVDLRFFWDYDYALSQAGWDDLKHLASTFSEEEISVLALAPDPIAYYKAHLGVYPAFTLPVTAPGESYWDALNEAISGNPAEAMGLTATRLVIVGTSARWHLWTEFGPEIAVIEGIAAAGLRSWVQESDWFTDPATAFDQLAPGPGPADFRRRFVHNFPKIHG
jgi:hypothetical protein